MSGIGAVRGKEHFLEAKSLCRPHDGTHVKGRTYVLEVHPDPGGKGAFQDSSRGFARGTFAGGIGLRGAKVVEVPIGGGLP
jgi:hypothetical protein